MFNELTRVNLYWTLKYLAWNIYYNRHNYAKGMLDNIQQQLNENVETMNISKQ